MSILILHKGSEDILYDIDSDTSVDYYLICTQLPDDRVERVMTFAYSEEYDAYFALGEDELFDGLCTLKDVERFRVADQHAAHVDCEVSIETLFASYPEYKDEWNAMKSSVF